MHFNTSHCKFFFLYQNKVEEEMSDKKYKKKYNDVLEGQRLFQELSAQVTWAAEAKNFEQVPQYAPIKFAGHESGDFFFVPEG